MWVTNKRGRIRWRPDSVNQPTGLEHIDRQVKPRQKTKLPFEGHKPHKLFYIVGPKQGKPIKIGLSQNPKTRLNGLQVSNWSELKLLFTLDPYNCYKLERGIYKLLAQSRLRGEWFDLTAPEMISAVYKLDTEQQSDPHIKPSKSRED